MEVSVPESLPEAEAEDEVMAELRQIRRDMLAEYGGDTLKMSKAIFEEYAEPGMSWDDPVPKITHPK